MPPGGSARPCSAASPTRHARSACRSPPATPPPRRPIHAGDQLARVQKARDRLEAELGRHPTLAELAAESDMDEAEADKGLGFAADPRSLSETLGEDSDTELAEVVADPGAASPFDEAAAA